MDYQSDGIRKLVETVNALESDLKKLPNLDLNGVSGIELRMVNELQVIEALLSQVARDINTAVRVRRSKLNRAVISDAEAYINKIFEEEKCETKNQSSSPEKSLESVISSPSTSTRSKGSTRSSSKAKTQKSPEETVESIHQAKHIKTPLGNFRWTQRFTPW